MLNLQKKSLQPLLGSLCLVAGLSAATSVLAADTLIVNQYMKPSQHLTSANGEYRLTFQTDGNLVLQRQSDLAQIWTSNTANQNGKRLVLGSDGNLTVQSHSKSPAWTSNTGGSRVNRLKVNNDGTLAIYDTANKQVWSTGTSQDISTRASTATVSYVGAGNNNKTLDSTMTIDRPSTTAAGDLMVLTIQTATGVVPTNAGTDWTRVARCQVETNTDTSCNSATADDDLGISVFYNYAGSAGAKTYTINKPDGKFTAAHLMVVRNALPANLNQNPIQSVDYFLDAGDGTLETKTTCKALSALSRGMNVCAMAHDDAQKMLTPANWTRRSDDAKLVLADSALTVFTRSSGTALSATTVDYNGNVIDGVNKGNGINVTYQIKPIP